MEVGRILILIALIVGLSSLTVIIYQTDNQKREIKEDLIELSNIKYSLFNVDEWKKILTKILAKKIESFELKGNNRKQLHKKISDLLYKMIDELEQRTLEQNSHSIKGFFKNGVVRFTDIFGRMKKDLPIFANQILDFVNDPKNKKEIKTYLNSKLNEYADSTFSKLDYSIHNSIIRKYKCADKQSTIDSIEIKLNKLQAGANFYKSILLAIAILTALFVFIVKTLRKSEFILISALCFIFLLLGLTLPMIEIDARLAEIKFSLMGEQINFKDQVLYYKSKSIIEVIKLMIYQGSFDLMLVGFLVFIFSVLFPVSKLFSTILVLSKPGLYSNKIIYFLINKTAKWSMADVMVVAIFMSYIGFSGILTEQLNQLENLSPVFDLLTTNKSGLQNGFMAFTAFAILSLLITNKLQSSLGKK